MLRIIDELSTEIKKNINKLDYPQELIERVDKDWLTKEFSYEFEGLNGNERAHVFMILSNREQSQTSLRDKIFKVLFEQFNRLTEEA
jgi:hypothetical protein